MVQCRGTRRWGTVVSVCLVPVVSSGVCKSESKYEELVYVVYYHRPFCFTAGFPRHFEFARLPRSVSTLGSEPKDARSALVCLSSGGADLDFKAGTQP